MNTIGVEPSLYALADSSSLNPSQDVSAYISLREPLKEVVVVHVTPDQQHRILHSYLYCFERRC